jgi:hypothetical protein
MLCFYLNGLPRAQLADRRAMGFIANTVLIITSTICRRPLPALLRKSTVQRPL